MLDERVRVIARQQPHPLIFATVSGAHLYGFPSADSDWDLRGVHLLPIDQVVGLQTGDETIENRCRERRGRQGRRSKPLQSDPDGRSAAAGTPSPRSSRYSPCPCTVRDHPEVEAMAYARPG